MIPYDIDELRAALNTGSFAWLTLWLVALLDVVKDALNHHPVSAIFNAVCALVFILVAAHTRRLAKTAHH